MVISTSLSLQKPTLPPKNAQIRNPKTWDSIIRFETKQKNDQEILNSYSQMTTLGVIPDRHTLPLVLKACTRLQAVEMGKKIHSDIQEMLVLARDVRIRTALIDFYCKCGLLEDAWKVFDETTDKDVVSWNAMICGYAGQFQYQDAIRLFRGMQSEKVSPSSVTLVGLLLACGELLEFRLGQEVHSYCIRRGWLDVGPHLGTSLITFYSKFDVKASYNVFDLMEAKNTVSWNAMISSYFSAGYTYEALRICVSMLVAGVQPSVISLLVAIQSCMDSENFNMGKQFHQLVVKFGFSADLFLVNALIKMYGKNGNLDYSRQLFESISYRDVALWNAMLSTYKEGGLGSEVFALFARMRSSGNREDSTTIAVVLSAITDSTDDLGKGRSLHAYVIKNKMELDIPLGNALLRMYSQFNCVDSAKRILSEMNCSDIVSWNTLISALAECKLIVQLQDLFKRIQPLGIRPNSYTMVSVLAACKDQTFLNIGRSIHGYAVRHDLELNLSLSTSLTDMYLNCGDEATAKHLFESMPNKDLVSWNAMITCYIDNNRHSEAVSLFYRMLREVEPNSVTIINILSSCAHLSNLSLSCSIHAYAVRREFVLGSHISMGNALVTMYARCGSLGSAEKVFKGLVELDVISWNAIIAAYGMHGHGKDSLIAFSQMKKAGVTPTSVTFVSVLSACSHAGLVEEGRKHFYSMSRDYNLTPQVVHYACMVDLLGRGGLLDEATKLISSMPVEPDASVWRALLGACRVYSEIKLARRAFSRLVELEPMNVGNYVLLSNIYAAKGLWEDVRRLRAELKEKNLAKAPGRSWIVIRSQVHKFTAGDLSHPNKDEIYTKLNSLKSLVTENGYVPDRRWVLQDIKDEEKDEKLMGHSEKLAITFGLLSTKGKAPILVNKNLRVCGDCHTFSKHVSKCVRREIILRDPTRFHHFVDGVCSCNDYW